jgi:hypothetical protein
MPIFKFLAVTGCILVALLFVADATLTPRGPLFTNDSEGIPRSEPIRTQEPQRQRAPALVQIEPPQTVAPPVAKAPPLADVPARPVAEATVPIPAAPGAVAASAPAAPEAITAAAPAAPKPVAVSAPAAPEPVAASAPASPRTVAVSARAAPKAVTAVAAVKPVVAASKRKPAARKPDRSGHYAEYRDRPNARPHQGPVENGYPYGVRPGEARAERRDWPPQWSGDDFGQNRWRF